jgi:hypothetical protein
MQVFNITFKENSKHRHSLLQILFTDATNGYSVFPDWLRYLEISWLTLISVIVVLTAGCLCLKCCKLCGYPASDDDNDDEGKNKTEHSENYKIRKPRPSFTPTWINSSNV